MMRNTLALSVCALLLACKSQPVVSIDFDRNFFGVDFSPYVKNAEKNGAIPGITTYTMDNLKTLLEVVSTKFSKLRTGCVDNYSWVTYVKNSTYYSGTSIRARTAEAAALLNRERNNKSLTVLIGVHTKVWEDNQQWQTGLQVAAEAAKIANNIYAGTVEGIYLYNFDTASLRWANLTLSAIRKLRSLTAGQGLSIGTQQYCHNLHPHQPSTSNTYIRSLWDVRRQIVLASDFIICFFVPNDNDVNLEVESIFSHISGNHLRGLENVGRINPKINAMVGTYWPNVANNASLESLQKFKNYWEKSNEFAKHHGVRTYIDTAFNCPIQKFPNTGWWRLTSNSLINNPTGYIEKISVLPKLSPTTAKKEIFSSSPFPRFNTEVSPHPKNKSVTLKPKQPSSTLRTHNKKWSHGFEYWLLAGVIGILTVILAAGLIFLGVKWRVQLVAKNATSPQYTAIASAPPNPVLCNLQVCLIESMQKQSLRQDHEKSSI